MVTERAQELMDTSHVLSLTLPELDMSHTVMAHTLWSSPQCFPMERHGDRDGDTEEPSLCFPSWRIAGR